MTSVIVAIISAAFVVVSGLSTDKFSRTVIKTPEELARYTDCSPYGIGEWLADDGNVRYAKQKDYEAAAVVMARGWGDCKGFAVVASETLSVCGIENKIVELRKRDGGGHAVVFFTTDKGSKGYINRGTVKVFPGDVSDGEVAAVVGGGDWTIHTVEGDI